MPSKRLLLLAVRAAPCRALRVPESLVRAFGRGSRLVVAPPSPPPYGAGGELGLPHAKGQLLPWQWGGKGQGRVLVGVCLRRILGILGGYPCVVSLVPLGCILAPYPWYPWGVSLVSFGRRMRSYPWYPCPPSDYK